jgi:23S rRNA pseudouridine1911/1915/1917 synthase
LPFIKLHRRFRGSIALSTASARRRCHDGGAIIAAGNDLAFLGQPGMIRLVEGVLKVLYEDNHLIAVNKSPSDIVQGDKTGDPSLAVRIQEYLREKYKKKGNVFIGVVHRLDRPVSGVVLYARTSKALSRMSEAFREGTVKKLYWALVAEKPPRDEGELVHYIRRDPALNKSFASLKKSPGAKEARLRYRLLGSLERYHLLSIELLTGRHHQIRAQLHAIGCHIKGDLKYGSPRSDPGGGIHLHSRLLAFPHPVGEKTVTLVADPPDETLWNAALELWKKREAAEKG